MAAWRPQHGPSETRPAVDALLNYLRSEGVDKIAVAGYCFGVRLASLRSAPY